MLFGLPIHRYLWNQLIYPRWNAAWEVPVKELLVIIMLVALSCVIAAWEPVKRIGRMNVVDVIADY